MTAGCGLRRGVIIGVVVRGGLGPVTLLITAVPPAHHLRSLIGFNSNATYDILLGCVFQRLDNVQLVFLPRTLHFL